MITYYGACHDLYMLFVFVSYLYITVSYQSWKYIPKIELKKFIPTWSSICNFVIVYIYIDNQCLTFPWFGFRPWLFDTIQTDSLCTLVFCLWVQRCIGLDMEMVDRLLKWTDQCVWRVIFVRESKKWDASFWSGRNSGNIVVLGLILFISAVSYCVIVLNLTRRAVLIE